MQLTVLGTPIVHLLGKLNPPTKLLGIIESYGWGGTATKEIPKLLKNIDAEVAGSVRVEGTPDEENLKEIVAFGKNFVNKIKKNSLKHHFGIETSLEEDY